MMKAAKLDLAEPGAGRSRVGVGQEQSKSRAEAGAGQEQGRNRAGAELSRVELGIKRAGAGQVQGRS